MVKLKTLGLLILFVTLAFETVAQSNPEDEFGAWYIFATNNTLSDKLTFNLQSQVRTYELSQHIEQFKVRSSFNYKVKENLNLALGYAYFRVDPSYLSNTPQRFDEHRIVADVVLKNKVSTVGITQRYRGEQRIFNAETSNDNSLWLRYMLKLSQPISEKLTLDIYDEIFLNVESPVFAQNWLGVGLSYKISDRLSTRLGYQRINLETRAFDRMLLSVNLKTDFRKPKN